MVRTKQKVEIPSTSEQTPDAILCSDLHLREDTPTCRTDDYWKAQWGKVQWLRKLSLRHNCPILCAGDIFHHWKPSPYLIRMAHVFLPKMMVVAGQHDLPQHNLGLLEKSGLGVLEKTGKVYFPAPLDRTIEGYPYGIIQGFSYGEELKPAKPPYRIAIVHRFTWKGKPPWPGAPEEGNVKRVMKELRGFVLIVTGDNHIPFEKRNDQGQLLVNPGSMMRMTADQADHHPRVYLWYARKNQIIPKYYPIEEGVICRKHLDEKTERDKRMDAYVSRLREDVEISLSFEQNIEEFMRKNKINKHIQRIVWKALEEDSCS